MNSASIIDDLIRRYDYYKETGARLCAREIRYYKAKVSNVAITPEIRNFIEESDREVDQMLDMELRAIQEAESNADSLLKYTKEMESINEKLKVENESARDYNLKMEELKANNDLKMKSLIIVMTVVFLPIVIMLLTPMITPEYVMPRDLVTAFFTLAGIMIGTFLKDLLAPKN